MIHLKEKNINTIENFEFKTCDPYFFNNFFDFKAYQILDSRDFQLYKLIYIKIISY